MDANEISEYFWLKKQSMHNKRYIESHSWSSMVLVNDVVNLRVETYNALLIYKTCFLSLDLYLIYDFQKVVLVSSINISSISLTVFVSKICKTSFLACYCSHTLFVREGFWYLKKITMMDWYHTCWYIYIFCRYILWIIAIVSWWSRAWMRAARETSGAALLCTSCMTRAPFVPPGSRQGLSSQSSC